jgi:glycosyltransferase involved in cell wall biosynthesis
MKRKEWSLTGFRQAEGYDSLVSIIIPAYNASKYIGRTLDSACAQTYSNLEIIVVNDGSTDDTPGIVAAAMTSDSRIRIITTVNRGVAAARNVGIETAGGAYLAFLDADDLWHPTKIEKQVRALEALPPTWGGVYTLYYFINDSDEILRPGGSRFERGYIYARHISAKFVGNGSALLVRREVIDTIGGFDPSYAAAGIGGCEDLDFELRLSARYKIEAVPERLVGYRIYPGNMSSDAGRMAFSLIRTVERALERTQWIGRYAAVSARATANSYAMLRFVKARNAVMAARTGAVLALQDPVLLASGFAHFVWMVVNARLRNLVVGRKENPRRYLDVRLEVVEPPRETYFERQRTLLLTREDDRIERERLFDMTRTDHRESAEAGRQTGPISGRKM